MLGLLLLAPAALAADGEKTPLEPRLRDEGPGADQPRCLQRWRPRAHVRRPGVVVAVIYGLAWVLSRSILARGAGAGRAEDARRRAARPQPLAAPDPRRHESCSSASASTASPRSAPTPRRRPAPRPDRRRGRRRRAAGDQRPAARPDGLRKAPPARRSTPPPATRRCAAMKADGGNAVQLLLLVGGITLIPALLFTVTGFTRILIVLGFIRNGLGTPTAPPNQVLVGIALFLTLFVMAPTFTRSRRTRSSRCRAARSRRRRRSSAPRSRCASSCSSRRARRTSRCS